MILLKIECNTPTLCKVFIFKRNKTVYKIKVYGRQHILSSKLVERLTHTSLFGRCAPSLNANTPSNPCNIVI